ncbi:MAG: PIG-L deacetylase family protein [Acidimicrobiales bacterium]|nr:PIG-L deacetylase family protein [Acidimicrobiales bacterium]
MALADLIHTDDDFVPTKALLVVAHPDDVDFGAAGTVATLTDNGVEVVYGLVTSGQAGEPAHLTPDELREIRQKEQTEAAAVVGVTELHWLDFPDGHLVADLELRKAIARLIRIVKPDLVITQTPVRNLDRVYAAHPDHLAAGEATVCAVYPDARNGHSFPELLAEGHEPHAVPRLWLMAGTDQNLHVDITDAIDRKIEALLAHHSQNDDRAEVLPGMIREWAEANAALVGHEGRAIESFRLVHTE